MDPRGGRDVDVRIGGSQGGSTAHRPRPAGARGPVRHIGPRAASPDGRPRRTRGARPHGHPRPVLPGAGARERLVLLLADVTALVLAVTGPGPGGPWRGVYASGVLAALAAAGLYRPRLTLRILDDLPTLLACLAVAVVPLALAVEPLPVTGLTLRTVVTAAVALPLLRWVAYGLVRRLRRSGRHSQPVVIVGAGGLGCDIARLLAERPEHGLSPVGLVDTLPRPADPDLPAPLLGSLDELDAILDELAVRHLIIAFGPVPESRIVGLVRMAMRRRLELYVVPRFFDLAVTPLGNGRVDEVWGIPLCRVPRAAVRSRALVVKRAVDVCAAGAALLLTAPLQGLIALAIRAEDGGPVLFRQERLGRHGHPIEVLKFRSMPVEHDGDTVWSAEDRSTRVGRWLRRTSLDELPQLWNVLRGDMSLVGPRPERPLFVDSFDRRIPGYDDRHRLPVGVTGWAQVNGLRGDTSIPERARFDNFYVEHWSLWFDMKILFATAAAVLRDVLPGRRGAED
ncbi:MAG: sugar transferase [Actinobacteria bacterium]|nr:sugar transferase [Actinomycetota bacterium]